MKKSKLHFIKSTGHTLPDAYFDTFEQRLTARMEIQDLMASRTESAFKVPTDYFENFDGALDRRLKKSEDSKLRNLFSFRNITYISGLAAAVIIMLSIFSKSGNAVTLNQVETASIENYLTNENLNVYDITALLNTDDISSEDFVTNTLSEESLENYLLNNASIEDLIAEK